jgi:hypothetical protein
MRTLEPWQTDLPAAPPSILASLTISKGKKRLKPAVEGRKKVVKRKGL